MENTGDEPEDLYRGSYRGYGIIALDTTGTTPYDRREYHLYTQEYHEKLSPRLECEVSSVLCYNIHRYCELYFPC
jgi:hypothetical protein